LKSVLQQSLTVFPKSAIFIKPTKRTLYNPAFGNNRKSVQFVAFGNLNFRSNKRLNRVSKVFTCVTAINQKLLYTTQITGFIAIIHNHFDCSIAVGYISCCNHNDMGQAQDIDPDV